MNSQTLMNGWRKKIDELSPPKMPIDKLEQEHTTVKEMVNRFLGWKLPEDFHPDSGITFKPTKPYTGDEYGNSWWPIGTNVFSADQATAMVEYMLDGKAPPPAQVTDGIDWDIVREYWRFNDMLDWDDLEAMLKRAILAAAMGTK